MKKLVLLVILLLGVKGYSQDPELFDRVWYLHYGILDGEFFEQPTPNFGAFIYFENTIFDVFHQYCSEGTQTEIVYDTEVDQFTLSDEFYYIIGICSEEEFTFFMSQHYSIYYEVGLFALNPFTYTIESDGANYMLTIENGEGDIAVYGNVPLSQPEFLQLQVTLYPNPVSDVLYIHSADIINKVSVYDIHGKIVKYNKENSHKIEIDVNHLPSGVYFVKTENLYNKISTKRFIKK